MKYLVTTIRVLHYLYKGFSNIPLLFVPHTSHWIKALRPLFCSSRFPQSVQKTRDPIAAITTGPRATRSGGLSQLKLPNEVRSCRSEEINRKVTGRMGKLGDRRIGAFPIVEDLRQGLLSERARPSLAFRMEMHSPTTSSRCRPSTAYTHNALSRLRYGLSVL